MNPKSLNRQLRGQLRTPKTQEIPCGAGKQRGGYSLDIPVQAPVHYAMRIESTAYICGERRERFTTDEMRGKLSRNEEAMPVLLYRTKSHQRTRSVRVDSPPKSATLAGGLAVLGRKRPSEHRRWPFPTNVIDPTTRSRRSARSGRHATSVIMRTSEMGKHDHFWCTWPEQQNGAETRGTRTLMALVPQCGDQIGIAQL